VSDSLPAWAGSAPVQQLLNALVDRLDSAQARGSAKAQTVALTRSLWPSFYDQPFESDREALWQQAQELAKLGLITLAPDRSARSASGYDMSPRIGLADAGRLRAAVGRMERGKSPNERWRDAVETHLHADETTKRAVCAYCVDVEGRSAEEVVGQLNEMVAFADSPMLLREVSSRLFWGMSKVLDNRQGLVAAVLGLDDCPFLESPIQLQVVLPTGAPFGVLFIENAMSFEATTRSGSSLCAGMVLVYASGFKASAKRLRRPGGASLFYGQAGCLAAGERDAFERWLYGEQQLPVFFWGDLDWSGMRILSTLRATFGEVGAWQPGYGPMREHLVAGGGHRPEAADKRGQQPLAATGCPYADGQLLPLLDTFGFVDQEVFNFQECR
jgi:hypothetical protein